LQADGICNMPFEQTPHPFGIERLKRWCCYLFSEL